MMNFHSDDGLVPLTQELNTIKVITYVLDGFFYDEHNVSTYIQWEL